MLGPDCIRIQGEYNQIRTNNISNSVNQGIEVYDDNNQIVNNYVSNNRDGISIREADNNVISENIVIDNIYYDIGFSIGGLSSNNTVTNNTARRIHGDLDRNEIYNNIYSRPLITPVFTANPPTIDGAIEEGEWLNKTVIKLNGFSADREDDHYEGDHYDGQENEKITKNADLYVMNDRENIYIAVVIEDKLKEAEDFLYFGFDQEADSIHEDGDEDRALSRNNAYYDSHWNVNTWFDDNAIHGTMSSSYSNAERKYVYEFKKPLNSGDSQDMNLKAGDKVGFRIEVYDKVTKPKFFRFPMDTVDHDVDPNVHSYKEDIIFSPPFGAWKKWADLIIAKYT